MNCVCALCGRRYATLAALDRCCCAIGGLLRCAACGADNAMVNQCGCDKSNLPTPVLRNSSWGYDATDMLR